MYNRNIFPLAGFDNMRREVGRLFGDMLGETDGRREDVFPALNVWENEENLFVEAEVPGITMDDLELLVVNDELTIKGRRNAKQFADGTIHRRERGSGEFVRYLTLPLAVNADAVEATLKDGVLTIRLPKAAEARPRKIQVKGM